MFNAPGGLIFPATRKLPTRLSWPCGDKSPVVTTKMLHGLAPFNRVILLPADPAPLMFDANCKIYTALELFCALNVNDNVCV
jgi:hypothetical protein